MLRLMNRVTDKKKWHVKKIFDDDIIDRWRAEAKRSGDVTERMVDWIIAEVRYKAEMFQFIDMVIVYNGDVVKSDTAVPESTRVTLKTAAQALEDAMSPAKDFHPGSDDKVVDLVHPSLFPLVYGRSRILQDELIGIGDCFSKIGCGEVIPVPPLPRAPTVDELPSGMTYVEWARWPRETVTRPYSNKFQWLPCDVELLGPLTGCKISSYINNLHPRRHQDLYDAVEKVISCAIPMWNATLSPLDNRYRDRNPRPRISYTPFPYEPLPEDRRPQGNRHDSPRRLKNAILPEPETFIPPPLQGIDLEMHGDHSNLQVIVKLANIELTPEKPSYNGGTWHVEGQMNEHICATALYYYDCENITESRLAFRQESLFNSSPSGPNDQHEWLDAVYGCTQHGPQVQEIGDVVCKQGRLLTFPNTLQHQVQPFQLADPAKPGHRKILALFLIDPNIRVISTANVPPQQRDWWKDEIYRQHSLSPLPVELQEQIMEDVDFPMPMDEAKELRLELMEERSAFVEEQTTAFMSPTFSLCEH
ncbi:hypothetical protein AJ80_05434 [Polytolypa hystricis UAMH7299]|uniref:Uncharacterized protein n=1 Tax=Polytolypa hystricis (strain UAMH7299) TaxID=1447883 RepID=A0A2B7Y2L8_POLH7|nr:hypothetical protein AJ80_05434 [Polytolypa hystricis UAMH7299]